MNDVEHERHVQAILDAGIPDHRARAQRYDPAPVVVRLVETDGFVLVKVQAPDHRDREPLLQAIRARLGPHAAVRFTP